MLACPACGATHRDRWRCACGAPLEFAERPLPDGPGRVDPRRGLWAFADFIPVERRVSLGEGFTPLVDAPTWNAAFKLESVFPTGSFKDRGATTTLSRAVELGVDRVLEDSSGNAGHAVATYAARAGLDAEIYVPAGATPDKLRAIERTGAAVVRIEGDRADVTDACVAAVAAGEGWYASHAWNPAFLEGTATVAHEIAAQRDWSVPDAVVVPVGHGTLLLGAHRGFRALAAAGWTDRVPRLLAVQATGCAPVVAAVHPDGGNADGPGAGAERNDAADGIQIRDPVRREGILQAIADTGGDAVAVDGPATERARADLARAGFDVEPTGAVGVAGLAALRDRGVLGSEEDVVVALTGSGLKT